MPLSFRISQFIAIVSKTVSTITGIFAYFISAHESWKQNK